MPRRLTISEIWGELQGRETSRAYLSRLQRPRPESVNYSIIRGKCPAYAASNRYKDVVAYDRSGVVVGEKYLNANVIPDGGGRWWVAAQAPLPNDFGTFFRAIYTHAAGENALVKDMDKLDRTHAILVQLTGWSEGGRVKAHDYMPSAVGETVKYKDEKGEISLRLVDQVERADLSSTYSTLELSDGKDKPMHLHHYYFGAWPDHGVPQGDQVDRLAELVDQVREDWKEKKCEVWVHCSAGVGRTGTFLALLSLSIDESSRETGGSPLGPLEKIDAIAERVDTMREYRCMLVQTPEQLCLIYEMLGVDREWDN